MSELASSKQVTIATARPSETSLLHNVCDEFTYEDFGPDALLVHDRRGFDAVTRTLTLTLARTLQPSP